MQNRYIYLFRLLLAGSDIVLVNIALLTAISYADNTVTRIALKDFIIISNLLWLVCTQIFRLYHIRTVEKSFFHTSTIKSLAMHFILLLVYVNTPDVPLLASSSLIFFYTLLCLLFLPSRYLSALAEAYLRKKFKENRQVAFIGVNRTNLQLAHYIKRHHKQRYSFYEENHQEPLSFQMQKAAAAGVNEVYVSLSRDNLSEADLLLKEADRQCMRVKFVPDFSDTLNDTFRVNYVGDLPVISLQPEPLYEMSNRMIKRLFDIAVSVIAVVFVLSWLYPIIAILIKLESKGPVLFKQQRSGRDNVSFACYKFRSMRVNEQSDKLQASKNDNRITRIGKFMRKTSIDELPQFFNVLQGNMSVVGPRPHMLKHTEEYRDQVDRYMVRHYLKPGITGWAQINGYRGETHDIELMEKRVEHDLWYLENWSALLDLKIVLLTVVNVVKGEENAY